MQDNWQEFDRQIQSVLQDAGEKAPRRVWRAVSARLDSAASAALWWKWAVPAFVAAALVAGLFLTGTLGTTGSKDGQVDKLAQTEVVPSEESAGLGEIASSGAETAELVQLPATPVIRMGRAGALGKRISSPEDTDVVMEPQTGSP